MRLLGKRLTPNGVNFTKVLNVDYRLSGTQLSFNTPASNVSWAKKKESYRVSHDVYNLDFYQAHCVKGDAPKEFSLDWFEWHFWGFPVVERDAYAGLELDVKITHLPGFTNLFRPHRLVCAVERMLYTRLIGRFCESGNARLDWQCVEINGHEWFTHRFHYIDEHNRDNYGFIWQTPISAEHMITFCYRMDIVRKSQENACVSYFEEFISLLLKSLKIKLSTQSLEDQKEAQIEFAHERMPEVLSPYCYEQIDWYDRQQMLRKVAEGLDDSYSMPDEEFYKLVDDAQTEQEIRYQEKRSRIMNTHMRFTDLEAEDLKKASKS